MKEIIITEKILKFVQAGLKKELKSWETHLGNVSYGEGVYFSNEEMKEIMKKFEMDEDFIEF